ncbi:MAG: HAMP domain-containing sensor histidine kinase [Planctomycetota bacterium]
MAAGSGPWPRSLHARLVALLLSLLLGLGTLLLAGMLHGSRLFFEEVHARLDEGVAEHIAGTLKPQPDGSFAEKDLKGLFMDIMIINPALEVYLVDLEGQLLAYDAPEERILRRRVDLAPVRQQLEGGGERVVRGDDPRSLEGCKPISAHPVEVEGEHVGYLYVILGGQGYDTIFAALRQSWVVQSAAAMLGGILVVSGVIGVVAVGRLTRPLRRLRGKMASFPSTASADEVSVEDAGSNELRQLELAFEAMSARIQRQVRELELNDERRREFVAGISHDLRTPASALQGYLETLILKASTLDEKERTRCLETALRQSRRLGKLVDQLFELARLEAREDVPQKEVFSLAELVQDIVFEFQVAAERKGITLRAVFPYDLPPVAADIGLIQRALDNLLDNALKYTTPGGEVVVRLAHVGEDVEVRVTDAGPGIPAEELPRLFDRFYRVETASREPGAGAGLGLAITRRIVELHEGRISVESTAGEGTTFRFALRAEPCEGESEGVSRSDAAVNRP